MNMYISESKNCLQNSGGMSIYLLDSIQGTLSYTSRKHGNLVNSYNAGVCYNKKIKFIIDPVKKYKGKKYYPVQGNASPKETTSNHFYYILLIRKK